MFQAVIGEAACLTKVFGPPPEDKTPLQLESECLSSIQEFCEKNGKPCCINLITEGDLKFLKSLEPVEEPKAAATDSAAEGEQPDPVEVVDPNLDEIDLMILKEEQEAEKAKKDAEENQAKEAKLAKEKKAKDEAMAAKMEDIRRQERDLLDQRSQPIR